MNSLSVILSMVSYRFLINTEPGDTTNNINLDGNTYLIVHISYPFFVRGRLHKYKKQTYFAITLFTLPVIKDALLLKCPATVTNISICLLSRFVKKILHQSDYLSFARKEVWVAAYLLSNYFFVHACYLVYN
jgi:hypothetical protein